MNDAELIAHLRQLATPEANLAADQIEGYTRGLRGMYHTACRIAQTRDTLLTALRLVMPLAEVGFHHVHPTQADKAARWLEIGNLALGQAEREMDA